MPQPFNSNDELSLRHLPDVSDSSFSFQIPGAIRDNLLADDDLDFFKGTDVSIAPLASPLREPPPSTLTPKPEKLSSEVGRKVVGSFPTLSYGHSEDHDTIPKRNKAKPHQESKFTTTNVSVFSKPKPKPKAITTPSAVLLSSQDSPAVRLDNLRVELNMFSDNLFDGPSTSAVNHQDTTTMPTEIRIRPKGILKKKSPEKKKVQYQISPRNNQKVIEGGISKRTRSAATKLSSITSCAPGRAINAFPNALLSDAQQVNGDYSFADSSVSSATAAAGVAGRLVMYGQKLINNSFGPLNNSDDKSLDLLEQPNNACQTFTFQDQLGEGSDVDLDADKKPLTLSQLSPQKVTPSRNPTPTPRDSVPISPLRLLPTKRSISVVASNVVVQHHQKRKKSKIDTTTTTSADVSESKLTVMPKTRRLPATRKYPKVPKPISSTNNSNSGRSMRRNKVMMNGPRIKRPPVFKPEVPGLGGDDDDNRKEMGIVATSASSSREEATSASTSRLKNSNEKGAEPVNSLTLNNKGKSIASSSSSHGSSKVVPRPATKPVPFNLQTDKRGVDDTDQITKTQTEKRTTIPNFKAMHAAQEAELALRKENIQPVVPLPIQWETDYRLKERQKFDEKMREKGKEHERLMTLRRKEREEEEEREVRELRKKAVPKAHEVPEWYKEAPKKQKKDNAIVGAIDG